MHRVETLSVSQIVTNGASICYQGLIMSIQMSGNGKKGQFLVPPQAAFTVKPTSTSLTYFGPTNFILIL